MTKIIQDYGKTVDAKVYIEALQGHQYIPQADQCIRNIVRAYSLGKKHKLDVIDIGCGPGRLTFDLEHPNTRVLGIDISESFIRYAKTTLLTREPEGGGSVSFFEHDFTKDPVPRNMEGLVPKKWHVAVVQGVLHHLHGDDRVAFIKRCHRMLSDDGILIIGDEFIPNYTTLEDRRLKVAAFYLHIIGEALKGEFKELAFEEAKNFIDDVLSGEKGCGHADEDLIGYIQDSAKFMNEQFVRGVEPKSMVPIGDTLRYIIDHVRKRAEKLADQQSPEDNFNRGDYKVSIDAFLNEMEPYGFVLKKRYEIGPVEQLGGMGVLVFMKA